jgi:hypothetical protein
VTDLTFSQFLERSLVLLERGAPRAHRALREHLAGLDLGVSVDREALSLVSGPRAIRVRRGSGQHSTSLRTSRTALRELLEGHTTLLDAILDDRFELRGSAKDLVSVDEAFSVYLQGAVRSPGFPELFSEFVGTASRRGGCPPSSAEIDR